jgi:hypothetical protein
VSNNRCFVAVGSGEVDIDILHLAVSIPEVKILSTTLWVGLEMEDSSRSLVECIVWDWTFSRIKIQDLTMLVRPDVDSFMHYASRRTFWENKFHHHFFCCCKSLDCFRGDFGLFLFGLWARYILDVFLRYYVVADVCV